MGLLDKLGLPTVAAAPPPGASPVASPVAPAGAPAAKPAAPPSAPAAQESGPEATVLIYNAGPHELFLQSTTLTSGARFTKAAPAKVAPGARATFRIADPTGRADTDGEAEYGVTGEAKARVRFMWKGSDAEIAIDGLDGYATASTTRTRSRNSKRGSEYLLVMKHTAGVRRVMAAIEEAAEEAREAFDDERRQEAAKPRPKPNPKPEGAAQPAPQAPAGPGTEPAGGAAAPGTPPLARIRIVNRSGCVLSLGKAALDGKESSFKSEPPRKIGGGATATLEIQTRFGPGGDPEFGGQAQYLFVIEPPLPECADGQHELSLAWSSINASGMVSPSAKGLDVATERGDLVVTYTFDAPEPAFEPPAAESGQPTLRRGDKSGDGWVEYLQELLNLKGARLEVDGVFGGQTQKAVVTFQRRFKKEGVLDDGVVGNQTWSYLREGAPEKAGTDGRKPHSHVEGGEEARWTMERGVVFHDGEDTLFLSLTSVGDADALVDRGVRVRLTTPDGRRRAVEATIGPAFETSRTKQGSRHNVLVTPVAALFGDASVMAGEWKVEAYLPADLGGDRYEGTITIAAKTHADAPPDGASSP